MAMGCSVNPEFLLKAKIFALLHDPAWKPFIVGRVLSKYGSSRIVKELMNSNDDIKRLIDNYGGYENSLNSAHEAEAFTVAKVIADLKGIELKEAQNVLRRADPFSSGLDRYLSLYYYQKEKEKKEMGPSTPPPHYKLNIFNPDLKYPFDWDKELPARISDFLKDLLTIYTNVKDPELRYNALYITLELLWYYHNHSLVPVADTRVPTHSVFDHLYATSALVNWLVCDDEPRGYFVKIDIPGIQDIISKARKASDLWAGSWIISYLTFKTVEPLALRYGADLILEPFMGLNPFFVSMVIKKLEESEDYKLCPKYKNAVERIKKIIPESLRTPYQPMMPGTVYLMLPPSIFPNRDSVVSELKKNYVDAWQNLVKAVKEVMPEIPIHVLNDVNIDKHPIAPLKVYVLDVNDEYKGFLEIGKNAIRSSDASNRLTSEIKGDQKISEDTITKELLSSLFIEYLLSRIGRASESPKLKVGYTVSLAYEVQELTRKYYEEKKRYLICTSCGVLPAVVSGSGEIDLEQDNSNLNEMEHLCPYCYLKRLIGKSNLGKSTGNQKGLLDELGFHVEDSNRPIFSTSDLANLNLWKRILEVAKKCGAGNAEMSMPRPLSNYSSLGHVYNYLAYNAKIFERLPESKRQEVNKAIEELKKFTGCMSGFAESVTEEVNTYYGIVKGDGDFIGKRVARGGIKMSLSEYLRKTRNGFSDEEMKIILNNASILAEIMIRMCLGPEEVLEKLNKKCDPNVNIPHNINLAENVNLIPVTPAYITALSRALMVTAFVDSETVGSKGQLVYAGGDDVMFLSPPEDTLDLLIKTRNNYWTSAWKSSNSRPIIGFHNISNSVFDALSVYGRSYGVLMAHYKDPVYMLWELASKLEEMKDLVCIKKGSASNFSKTKDVTVFLGGRGVGSVEDATIIYNYPENADISSLNLRTLELLRRLKDHIRKGPDTSKELSLSFIQDWLEFDKEVFETFPAQSIDYLFRKNVLVRDWKNKLKDLYNDLINMNVSIALNSDKQCNDVNLIIDQRHEIIKAYKFMEV
jgi:CRISPR-associated protein Cmr2